MPDTAALDTLMSEFGTTQPAPPAAGTSTAVDSLMSEFGAPETSPDNQLDNSVQTGTLVDATKAAIINNDMVAKVGTGMSMFDDYTEQLQKDAQKQAGKGATLVDIGPQERAESVFRFMVKNGYSVDVSVMKGERLQTIMNDVADQTTRFLFTTGYKDIATPKEAKDIESAFLFREMAARMRPHPERWDSAAQVGFDTLISQQGQLLSGGANPNADYASRFEALSRLQNLHPVAKAALVREAHRKSGMIESDTDYAKLKEANRLLENGSDQPALKNFDVVKSIQDVAIVFGTDDPHRLVSNNNRKVQEAYTYKDLGFINGDITQHGVMVVDPSAPAGLTALSFLPTDTIAGLERRHAERRTQTFSSGKIDKPGGPLDVPVDDAQVSEFIGTYGDKLGREKLMEALHTMRATRIEQLGQRLSFAPDAETMLPEGQAALSMTDRAFLGFATKMETVFHGLHKFATNVDKGIGQVPAMSDIAKQWTLALTNNERLARRVTSFGNAYVTIMQSLVENSNLLSSVDSVLQTGVAARNVLLNPGIEPGAKAELAKQYAQQYERAADSLGKKMIDVGSGSGAEIEAFKNLNPETQAKIFETLNSGPALMAQVGAAADAEQDERTHRMAAYMSGKGSSAVDLFKDTVGTMYYQIGAQARMAVGDVMQNPGAVLANIVGGAGIGKGIEGVAAMRKVVTSFLLRGTVMRDAAKIVADRLPIEFERVQGSLHAAEAAYRGSAEVGASFRRASVELEALRREAVAAEGAGAYNPDRGTVARFAHAMAEAYPHMGEFKPQVITDLVNAMPIQASTGELVNAVRFMQSKNGSRIESVLAQQAGAAEAQNAVMSMSRRMLQLDPANTLGGLRAQLMEAETSGNLTRVTEISDKIASLGVDPDGPVSPLDALRLITEKDQHLSTAARLTQQIQNNEKRLAKDPNNARALAEMDEDRFNLAQAHKNIEGISDKLRNGSPLDKIDIAQLLVARDTGKLGWGFLGKAGEKFHNGIARLFGTENIEAVKESATAAERLLNFSQSSADDWIDLSARNGAAKMRQNLLYRRAHVEMDYLVDAADAEVAMLKTQLANGVDNELRAGLEQDLAGLESYRTHIFARRDQLLNEWRSVQALPMGKAWSFRDSHLRTLLNDEDIVEIAHQNPEFFDFEDYHGVLPGADGKYDFVQAKIRPLDEEIANVEGQLHSTIQEKKKLTPAYNKAREAKVSGQELRSEVVAAGGDEATKVAPVAKNATDLALLGFETVDTRRAVLTNRMSTLRRERHGLAKLVGADRPVPKLQEDLNRLFDIDDGSQALQRQVNLLKTDVEAAQNLMSFGNTNPFTSNYLPLHMKGRLVYQNLLTTKHRLQSSGTHLKALADWLNKASPEERKLAQAALKRGVSATELLDSNPELGRLIEQIAPDGKATFARNIDNYLKHESAFQAAMLEDAYAAGMIEEAEYKAFKRKGYDPHMYGIMEGPQLIQDAKYTQLKRTYAKEYNGQSSPLSSDAVRFQRDLTQFRVHVREADGYITDELFDTAAAAREFVDRNWAPKEFKKVGNTWEATTTTGAPIRVAAPIGDDLQMLGFEKGATLERRIARFKELHQDVGMYRFLSSVRGVGGMVLTREEFSQAVSRAGANGAGLERQYIQLPDNRRKFGSVAGTFVHRKVLSEMNAMKYSFNQLESWLTSVMETYGDYSEFLPKLFGRIPVAGDKLLRGVNNMVKFSQIITSWKSWAANHTSWLFFDHFVGGKLFASENLDNLNVAINMVKKANFDPRSMLVGDWAAYREAIGHGVINGSIFDASDADLRHVLLRAVGWDDAGKIAKHKATLTSLREEEAALIAAGKVKDPERFGQLQVAIAAEDVALRDLDAGRMKNMARQMSNFFLNKKGGRGLAPSGALAAGGERLRELYGMTDDIYRFASYLNLKRAGLTGAEASRRILDFAQNYGNLPAGISNLSRSPLGALVPAFPYEMTRLMKNYATKQPVRLTAALSLIPALNAIGAGLAGVPTARVSATARSSGNATSLDMVEDELTTLKVYNPVTHEAEDIIPLGRTMQPAMQMFSEYGILSEAAKRWLPEEDDSLAANAGRAAARWLGSYVLNTPIVNNAFALFQGIDPVTGRPYGGEGVTLGQKVLKATSGMAKSIVPPYTPVIGRVHQDLRDSWDAPIHPETGKPYGTAQLGTILLREATGVAARGRIAAVASDTIRSFAKVAGIKTGPAERGTAVPDELVMISMMYQAEKSSKSESYSTRLPMYGVDAEKRKFWAQMMSDASTPEAKVEAEAGIRALAAKERDFVVNGMRYATTPTEREQANYLKSVRDRGSIEHFARIGLLQQTAVLIEANKASVNPMTVANYGEAVRLTDRWMDSYKQDPGQIAQAIAMTKLWVRDPRANDATKEWLNWLTRIEGRAINTRNREIIRDAHMEQLKVEGVIRR